MPTDWNTIVQTLLASPQTLALAGVGIGVLFLYFGVASLGRTPAEVRRMQAVLPGPRRKSQYDLFRDDDFDLGGLLRAFVPSSQSERTRIARSLRKAGVQRKNALYLYYIARAVLALGLPSLFLMLTVLPAHYAVYLPQPLRLAGMPLLLIFQISSGLALAGFYGPSLWLRSAIAKRRQRIRFSLPNALDLLQVAIEAGLGFDAAMMRVSRELAKAAPDVSAEFMMLQLELQAGKDRQAAFLEMADRADIDEMKAFANVILQASQYGSSVSAALSGYAEGIRQDRELKAQEKANRLPVQMSGVMAICMMPTLLMICLAPMMIRWIRMFGGG